MKPAREQLLETKRTRMVSAFAACICALSSMAVGCHRDMYDQPRQDPLDRSEFFDDHRSARPQPTGTIAYRTPEPDPALQTGRLGEQFIDEIPITVNLTTLRRGQERFNIYCSVCHGKTGAGDGMVVERGYKKPPTYHSDRLRGLPVGHFFEVMTQGYGMMPSMASQVGVDDRWAIAAYIRALQLSQFANVNELPAATRAQLEREDAP
jgi:mono/diheme cytochrome c family protein